MEKSKRAAARPTQLGTEIIGDKQSAHRPKRGQVTVVRKYLRSPDTVLAKVVCMSPNLHRLEREKIWGNLVVN